ncbi:class I SAM-dependent methyltransferase [Hymenobacter nitidus]|uniref:class I SAM-dependent methyltransferase n=1 Tax=Hymenobacter nitidus TaxID=2880929 RepID=UPI003D691B2F
MRKPLEGVGNVVRFNWPFYAAAAGGLLLLALLAAAAPAAWQPYAWGLLALAALPLSASLLASYYVYDYSDLYRFGWLEPPAPAARQVLNIHAGFDETSRLLGQHFAGAELRVFDFYDPRLHTEASIRRARAAYPPFPGTVAVQPQDLPLPTRSIDCVLVLLSAHEIRAQAQRVAFFREVRRVVQPRGRVVVVEHLRDSANFLAYTVGFLHFYSRRTWLRVFAQAGFRVEQEQKITPFVSAFMLEVNGDSA